MRKEGANLEGLVYGLGGESLDVIRRQGVMARSQRFLQVNDLLGAKFIGRRFTLARPDFTFYLTEEIKG